MSALARFTSIDENVPQTPSPRRSTPGTVSPRFQALRPSEKSPSITPYQPTQPHTRNRNDIEPLSLCTNNSITSPRTAKRRKVHARNVCQSNDLDDDTLDDFTELDTDCKLINIQGFLMKLEASRENDGISEILTSTEFKKSLQDRLMVCLLSPDITAYVTDINDRIRGLIQEKPGVFGIPAGIFKNQRSYAQLSSLAKELLTNCRSAMKQKLTLSLQTTKSRNHPQTINELTKSLAPKGMEISGNHWARIAYMRSALNDFNGLQKPGSVDNSSEVDTEVHLNETATSTYTTTQFWNYLDDQLVRVREEAVKKCVTKEEQEKWLQRFFSETLQEDLKLYSDGNKKKPTPPVKSLDWQVTVQQQLKW